MIPSYVIGLPSGEVIYVNLRLMNILCDYCLISFNFKHNLWFFDDSKREQIERILNQEKKLNRKLTFDNEYLDPT
jgi:hypothetical protein